MIPLVTERLILRGWREEDKPAFAAINADPEVMRFFPALLSKAESDALADRLAAAEAELGMTLFVAEEQASGPLHRLHRFAAGARADADRSGN